MTTAYTSLLGLALPVTGELSGTWGDTVNNSITSLLDSAIAGTTTLSADTTLTTTTGASNQARQAILLCTGHVANITITAPAQSKIYTVINASATYTAKIRGVGPTTGITIPVSSTATVAWNGSDFVDASGYINGNLKVNGTLTVTGVATFSAGTAALPAITTSGDTNTGILFPAADSIGFSTGGAEKGRFSSGAYGIFTVGTQSSVGGIGTNYGTLGAWGSSGGGLQIYRGTSAGTPVSTYYADAIAVSIIGQEAVPMLFSTGGAEKMRIASSVYGVVTVTPSGYDVASIGTDYATHGVFGSSGGGYRIYRGSAAGAGVAIFYADGTTGTQLYAVEANQPLNLGTNNVTKMTIGAVSGGVGAVGIGYTSLTSVGDNGLAVLGNVGIGTSSPKAPLHVVASAGAANDKTLIIQDKTAGNAGEAWLSFKAQESLDDERIKGAIVYANSGSAYGVGNLLFCMNSTADNSNATTANEKMRLDSSGNLVVGGLSARGRIGSYVSDATTTFSSLGYGMLGLQNSSNTDNNYSWMTFVESNGNYAAAIGSLNEVHSPASSGVVGSLFFATKQAGVGGYPVERARIDSSGNLRVGTTTGPASAKLVVAGGLSVNNNTDDATSVASYGNFFAKTTTVSPSVTTTIKNAIGSEAAMYLVSGSYSAGSIRFFDIVVTMGTGLTPVVVSSGGINSPPARTYSNTSEQLGINFGGANTYIVLVTGMGSNEAS